MIRDLVARWWPRIDVAVTGVLAITLGVALGLTVAAALDRDPPRGTIEYVLKKPAFRPGERFEAERNILQLRSCPGTVTRWMTSRVNPSVAFPLPPNDLNEEMSNRPTEPGVVTVPVVPFVVPPLPPGPADYHSVVDFGCNWLQRWVPGFAIRVPYPTIIVTILPP